MKILVVDDNDFLSSTIQSMLEHKGYEVMSAKDGIDGYSAYLLFKPDLIITDIQMPGGTGFAMMERVRTHNPMIKAIYMSGDISSFREVLMEEERKYPVSFLEKPFPLESLEQFLVCPTADPYRNTWIAHGETAIDHMMPENKQSTAGVGNGWLHRKRMTNRR